jgi:SAM-dependent methyltransferase
VNILINLAKLLGIVPAPMIDSVSCIMRGRAILEANRLGIFHALENGPLTATELAKRTETSVSGVEVLATALVACGYLRRRGERYANGRWVRKWILDSGLGLTHTLLLQLNGWDRASMLGECVRVGHPLHDPHEAVLRESSEAADYYVRGMRPIARMMIPHFVPRLELPRGARRLVDLGGSHGDVARAVLQRQPGLEATVYDLPGPVEAARRLAERDGDRLPVRFEAKDLLNDDLGQDWDVALMTSVAHHFDTESLRRVVEKVAAGLRPGGTLAVVDHLRGVSRGRDNVAAMMGLNWLTMGGRSYSLPEIVDLLKSVGFQRTRVTKLPLHIGATLVQAFR